MLNRVALLHFVFETMLLAVSKEYFATGALTPMMALSSCSFVDGVERLLPIISYSSKI